MTRGEREAFLAEPYVGVLSVTAEPDRAPLTTPIWYVYRPGGLVKVITAPLARKARLIEQAGDMRPQRWNTFDFRTTVT